MGYQARHGAMCSHRSMKACKFWDKDNCPCCTQLDENDDAFPYPQVEEAHTKQVEAFKIRTDEAHTDPGIAYSSSRKEAVYMAAEDQTKIWLA
jgi:hypothetical protein